MANETRLQAEMKRILEQAEEKGLNTSFFFRTTFERYVVQMKTLRELQKVIDEEGTTVTKEYVKGRKNLYVNPAISEYNKTSTAANNTVGTLVNIVKAFSQEDLSQVQERSRLDEALDRLAAELSE